MNRHSPLYAQFLQEQRKRENQKNQNQHRQRPPQSQSEHHQTQPEEEITPLLRARAAQLERERLQNTTTTTTLYNTPPPRRYSYSVGPSTPESPPFLHAPPNTPHTPPPYLHHRQTRRAHSHADSDIHTLTPSSRGGNEGGNGDAGWGWMSWVGAAFVVVLGVVLLGKQEDDVVGSGSGSGEASSGSGENASWGFGEVGRILVWILWGLLAWGCWVVGGVLYEAAVAGIRERERERGVLIVDGRRGGVRGRERGRSGRRWVDEDSEDEYLDERKR
ncbi:hypothetical protein DL98DRAFT_589443 [Cadophora sp. DSE1049]|nr:hypothetical protein DL98DRAFT_589443 [Cadophora sp. DSE1049]